ncbi:GLPGLI family protein [Ancylomarina euxinus]|uniref:GLPGLI family protein n=1 Tax=Ancylomarina euxinus TaxID=2283627 RepID=A0A425XXP2_9BACT|nr:GLPGLI family protein [Ancylomarina euxinus]MCZ4695996.1 GLPGLI family protein [Ancylomarina euxinus]MUP13937.1 GLPGLI family protein [Ancylomarina euxinus]RRG19493.1 GLPGLI family protein [Ancylomarina euxinus]
MKTKILLVSGMILFMTSSLFAQEFQGKAYYQSKTTINVDLSGRNIPENRKQMIKERIKKANEKTFILNFNQLESIYKEDVKLEQPETNRGGGMRFGMMGGNSENYYKNVKKGTYVVKNDLFGKIFLVQDSLPKLNWEMAGDTKKIGKYTVFKATATKTIKRPNMGTLFNRNTENKEQEYTEKEIQIVAWYSPEIPINQGPAAYWGLPGLILEISDDITTILCSEINMNPKEKVEIKSPSKGKVVNQTKYDEIAKTKMKEMRENFQNMRGGREGQGGRH